jgi:hypothetical protein
MAGERKRRQGGEQPISVMGMASTKAEEQFARLRSVPLAEWCIKRTSASCGQEMLKTCAVRFCSHVFLFSSKVKR